MSANTVATAALLASIAFTPLANAQMPCAELFLGGQEPVVTHKPLTEKYMTLCSGEYAVGHSGLSRTALWSAGVLDKAAMKTKGRLVRSNNFIPDGRIPPGERSELSDFARERDLQRGHLFAAADAITQGGQDRTFSLGNILGQNSDCNTGIWNDIENAARSEAKRRGRLYSITGPLFQGQDQRRLKGRVAVPSGIYKCLYDSARQESGCFIVNNAPGTDYRTVSVEAVEQTTGLSLFPAAASGSKKAVMEMPIPKPYRQR